MLQNKIKTRKMDANFSLDDFLACIENVVEISDGLMDGWKLQEKKGSENSKYIIKRCTSSIPNPNKNGTETLVSFEYHIVYNMSFGVPVLCFRAWRQDGSLLSMEEYWSLNNTLKESSSLYETLTQADHPVLCQPFLTLHPCRTQEIIQPFLGHSKNPIISWLSVVGPFVGLTLPDHYLKQC